MSTIQETVAPAAATAAPTKRSVGTIAQLVVLTERLVGAAVAAAGATVS